MVAKHDGGVAQPANDRGNAKSRETGIYELAKHEPCGNERRDTRASVMPGAALRRGVPQL